MLNYCIMCFGLHVCAITCKTLCRWLLLSCMVFVKHIGCSSGFCVACLWFSTVYSLQISTLKLIKAYSTHICFKKLSGSSFLSQVFHSIFQMITVIKGFMANGLSVVHYEIIQHGHLATREEKLGTFVQRTVSYKISIIILFAWQPSCSANVYKKKVNSKEFP